METTLADVRQQIDRILEQYHDNQGQLIGILLAVQECVPMHYIPEDISRYIAEKLNIKITQVYDVISFYASLHLEPRAIYPIQVCESIVCKVNEADNLLANLQAILGVGLNETTEDGKFIIEQVPCFGACDIAPAVRINGKVYGHLNHRADVEALLASLQE